MATKPILFSTSMVQAIQAGRKMQTRRVVKFPLKSKTHHISVGEGKEAPHVSFAPLETGDILWVRETWQDSQCFDYNMAGYQYRADKPAETHAREYNIRWKPSIFMPKQAARIFLKVTNVRAERLQDITEDDAQAEGVRKSDSGKRYFNYTPRYSEVTQFVYDCHTAKESFRTLWQSINGPESWEANPWVWVYEFEQIDKPKDFGHE